MSVELDIGPLSWVKGEIDLALERAGECLAAYAADPAGDGLSKARASMHQAHGALAIVGLEGITEFADAIEQLLAALATLRPRMPRRPSPPRRAVFPPCAATSTTSWPAIRTSR
jgi:HPt (histidine-containing phosphotransfer) domain-containing protein